jgi:hypothetical protein
MVEIAVVHLVKKYVKKKIFHKRNANAVVEVIVV